MREWPLKIKKNNKINQSQNLAQDLKQGEIKTSLLRMRERFL